MSSTAAEVVSILPKIEEKKERTLAQCVETALIRYFDHLNGEAPSGLYQMVLTEMEKPLLETVMRQVGGNQSRAAEILGINRGTLRTKLKLHDIK